MKAITKRLAKRPSATNRRYRLHQKIKRFCSYNPRKKTMYVPYNAEMNKDVEELSQNYGYCVQLEIV